MLDDDDGIPAFLSRPAPANWTAPSARRGRGRKIPYPRDGYLGRGLRSAARERLRAARRRHAERCRQR